MAATNSDAPHLDTYQAVVSAYSDFLTVAIHTILYERQVYPQSSFLKARKYNYPVRQSRHPRVCKWIQDAVAAVEAEMLKSTISSTSLIIHSPPPKSTPLERYVFSTKSFPRIPSSEILTPFATINQQQQGQQQLQNTSNSNTTSAANSRPVTPAVAKPPPSSDLPEQFRATLTRLTTSLSRLRPLPNPSFSSSSPSSQASAATPSPARAISSSSNNGDGFCTFTLAIELRDSSDSNQELSTTATMAAGASIEAGADPALINRNIDNNGSYIPPPIGREEDKRWIVAEPGWQPPLPTSNPPTSSNPGHLSGTNSSSSLHLSSSQPQPQPNDGRNTSNGSSSDSNSRGEHRGGVKTTPVRKIDAGAFRMEVWVEEGRGKFAARVEDAHDDDREIENVDTANAAGDRNANANSGDYGIAADDDDSDI